MTPLLFAAVALAGGLGAAARFVVDGAVTSRFGRRFPIGTHVINISGSLLLGIVTGLAVAGLVSAEWRLVLGTGFLGGYTTFSTASLETVRLLIDGRRSAAALSGFGMLVASVAAAALGLWIGSRLGS